MAGGPTTYALNRRQVRLYTYRVNLYRPNVPTIALNKKGGPRSYPDAATYLGVQCLYTATEDFQVNGIDGTMTENNIMTQDLFLMHVQQDVGPEWKIELTQPETNPNAGSFWTIQGEPKPTQSQNRRQTNQRKCYAKHDFRQVGMV